jgi:hypothetical protein
METAKLTDLSWVTFTEQSEEECCQAISVECSSVAVWKISWDNRCDHVGYTINYCERHGSSIIAAHTSNPGTLFYCTKCPNMSLMIDYARLKA